jgi:hypothetical protein
VLFPVVPRGIHSARMTRKGLIHTNARMEAVGDSGRVVAKHLKPVLLKGLVARGGPTAWYWRGKRAGYKQCILPILGEQ